MRNLETCKLQFDGYASVPWASWLDMDSTSHGQLSIHTTEHSGGTLLRLIYEATAT
jgi:hypothetical protein